ncbi:MAG: nuclear transport factor 2 family protein [Phycisphaerae bacterium]|nr:nuclear transport factor 2 family protein [Phycisphaerae bacterium]
MSASGAGRLAPGPRGNPEEIARVLDDFHDAASKADSVRYFGHFATQGVFLGTDATERWDVAAFRAYAEPHFSAGKGWTYHAVERHVSVHPDGAAAWFDERLKNAKFGECRGSGVLVRENGAWKIAQYNLTIPIPNDLAEPVVKLIAGPRGNSRP